MLLLFAATFAWGAGPYLKVISPVREQRLIFAYELRQPSNVEISLADSCGELIVPISSGMRSRGQFYEEYTLPFLPQGVYLLQLNIDNNKVERRVVIEKAFSGL